VTRIRGQARISARTSYVIGQLTNACSAKLILQYNRRSLWVQVRKENAQRIQRHADAGRLTTTSYVDTLGTLFDRLKMVVKRRKAACQKAMAAISHRPVESKRNDRL
jgi:CO dehydrogenase/acetyl-CoA synthase beta subunit